MPRIVITVPPRPEYDNAYWALGKRWATGTHVVDVTDAELAQLQGEPVIGLTTEEAYLAAAPADAPPAEAPAPAPGKPMKR